MCNFNYAIGSYDHPWFKKRLASSIAIYASLYPKPQPLPPHNTPSHVFQVYPPSEVPVALEALEALPMLQCWLCVTNTRQYLHSWNEKCLFYCVATSTCAAHARMSTQELVNKIHPCTNRSYSVRKGLRS